MQIRVRCGCGEAGCPEWAIVEAAFTFTVGYHELAGTKVALKKPLLVLRKKKTTAVAAETELEVIGVIRHKILFKDRPKALISKPQVKEKKTLPLPAAAAAPPPQSS
ncbi:hypothetical protein OsI_30790 [Oryza sativa Indica Group]|uniref:Uncharacterized protein n=1 Tax=Oryza sativa subsp. indica TaxID=39946 RepID=A2YZK8_ORYSI|nr:hypothetical protein OsI_30790 [Oryza sativa Indica Group]